MSTQLLHDDPSIDSLTLAVNYNCNSACRFCFIEPELSSAISRRARVSTGVKPVSLSSSSNSASQPFEPVRATVPPAAPTTPDPEPDCAERGR